MRGNVNNEQKFPKKESWNVIYDGLIDFYRVLIRVCAPARLYIERAHHRYVRGDLPFVSRKVLAFIGHACGAVFTSRGAIWSGAVRNKFGGCDLILEALRP